MSKWELLAKLHDLGYEAKMINRVPHILNTTYEEGEKVIKFLGYTGSYGVIPSYTETPVI